MNRTARTRDYCDSELLIYTLNIVLSYCEKQRNVSVYDAVNLIYELYGVVGNAGNSRFCGMPAVPIENSVHDDYIVCLEDGKRLKMLKRHLRTEYNMTPDEYRRKWGLPDNYPMVASEYAERRSHLARAIGLGRGKFHNDKN